MQTKYVYKSQIYHITKFDKDPDKTDIVQEKRLKASCKHTISTNKT